MRLVDGDALSKQLRDSADSIELRRGNSKEFIAIAKRIAADMIDHAPTANIEQESVEPFHVCIYGKRLRTLISNNNYIFCPYCGKKIKWK